MGGALCDTFSGTWTHAHMFWVYKISNCSFKIYHVASAKYRVGQRDASKRKDKRVKLWLLSLKMLWYIFPHLTGPNFFHSPSANYIQLEIICIHIIPYPLLNPSAFLFLIPSKILSLHGCSYFSSITKEVNFCLVWGTGMGRGQAGVVMV